MYKKLIATLFSLSALWACSQPETSAPELVEPAPSDGYSALIQEARELVFLHGEDIWPGIDQAPFGILLVQAEKETLYCHDGALGDFVITHTDQLTGCDVAERPAVFSPTLRASFPAVGGIPTVVIGTPEATGLSNERWILIVAHEHFHQMQMAMPTYVAGTLALDLHNGDQSGMWMLNYPFPYTQPETVAAFREMTEVLAQAIQADDAAEFKNLVTAYLTMRDKAQLTVSAQDWRYIELQLWQEGVARWTEYQFASKSADYPQAAEEIKAGILGGLTDHDLAEQQRVSLYAIGAGEALILDRMGHDWKQHYWAQPFQLRSLFQESL